MRLIWLKDRRYNPKAETFGVTAVYLNIIRLINMSFFRL